VAFAAAQPALAKDILVNMKTQGASGLYVFEPAYVKADVGDKIHFKPNDPTHNAETIAGMLPAGVAPSKGVIGKEFVLTLTKPGIYGVECLPHISMGMVALVQAGKGPSANLAAAKAVKLPPLAAKRMTPMLAKAS
jgi:pseudoazurin